MKREPPKIGDLEIPVLGQGTWRMGEDPAKRTAEVAALREGIDLGMTLIDTAEMYAEGGAEEVVGEACEGRRDEVFLVTKVLPANASRQGTIRACRRSLKRLRTGRIDLYLLHWAGPHPLEETFEAFALLQERGEIGAYGVSNFDPRAMREALDLAESMSLAPPAANQILYNLRRRGPERSLLPLCRERGVTVMAYSPFDQGGLPTEGPLREIASKHRTSPETCALAWILGREGVVTIPKSSNPAHVRANAEALDLRLDEEDLALLDRAFPIPEAEEPLEWN